MAENEKSRTDPTLPWMARGKEQAMTTEAMVQIIGDTSRPAVDRANAGRRLAAVGDQRLGVGVGADGLPSFAWSKWIAAGPFIMGSSDSDTEAMDNEKPQHSVSVGRFRVCEFPVTNRQFRAFVDAEDGWASDSIWSKDGLAWRTSVDIWQQEGRPDNFPCMNVSWYAAVAFAAWASDRCAPEPGCRLRLPTEPEWERACRGTDGRRYPWGPDCDSNNCSMVATGIGDLCSVGVFPGGRSPVGAFDMSGGTWEWCFSLSSPYPYRSDRETMESAGKRVIRGGAYNQDKTGVRCAVRREDPPGHAGERISFRLVCAPTS